MVNYQLGKIYKIVGNGMTYYGSTCQPTLARRLQAHRTSYDEYLKQKRSNISSFKILETENYEIILVENYPCNNKDELRARERYWIENNECVNKNIPGRTKKEYNKTNEEHYKIIYKEYYEANKEKINEKHLCLICGGNYTTNHKSKHEKTKKHIKALELTNL